MSKPTQPTLILHEPMRAAMERLVNAALNDVLPDRPWCLDELCNALDAWTGASDSLDAWKDTLDGLPREVRAVARDIRDDLRHTMKQIIRFTNYPARWLSNRKTPAHGETLLMEARKAMLGFENSDLAATTHRMKVFRAELEIVRKLNPRVRENANVIDPQNLAAGFADPPADDPLLMPLRFFVQRCERLKPRTLQTSKHIRTADAPNGDKLYSVIDAHRAWRDDVPFAVVVEARDLLQAPA